MRRKDRQVTDIQEIKEIMKACDVCRLGLNDNGYPYIVPLNFAFDFEGDKLKIYFHSALEGKKIDLIKKDPRAAFEMDCEHVLEYFPEKGYCTMAYKSVMGKGLVRFLEEEEKYEVLEKLMNHYHSEKVYFNPAAINRTAVYCLEVEEYIAKNKERKGK